MSIIFSLPSSSPLTCSPGAGERWLCGHSGRAIFLMIVLALFSTGCARISEHQKLLPVEEVPEESTPVIPAKTPEQQLEELNRIKSESTAPPTLGRGDILNVSVYDEPDLTIGGIPVRPDGKISFPLIGDVQAEGVTVETLTASISSKLERYILSPKVSVIVHEFNSQQYTIFGEVVKPGIFQLKTDTSLTEALAAAGGLNKGQFRATHVELADLTHAYIARDGKILPVDFVRLVRNGDLRYDISLESGDYIYIPSGLAQEVYILGEVKKPSMFAYRENLPMSRTMSQAEGFTPDADLKRIHIVRGALHNPEVIVVNFAEVMKGNAREVALQPNDIVYVPPTRMTRFSRVVDKIIPTIQALQMGIILSDTTNN